MPVRRRRVWNGLARAPLRERRACAACVLALVVLTGAGPPAAPARPRTAAGVDSMRILVEDHRFGSFGSASHIDVDVFGRVYVTDEAASTLSVFALDGTLIRSVGGPGWSNEQFDRPAGIDARLGIVVYVADRGNHRIVRLDRTLSVMGVFETRDLPDETVSFGDPMDVALSKRGNLFILDGENARILSTSGFATVDRSFGDVSSGNGRLVQPVAMSMSDNDVLYVLDKNRLVLFDAFGNFLRALEYKDLDGARGIAAHGDRVFVVTPDRILLFASDGALQETLTRERCVFAGETGPFRDLAIEGSRMLLLTDSAVIVLQAH